jgi:hypothetical protein
MANQAHANLLLFSLATDCTSCPAICSIGRRSHSWGVNLGWVAPVKVRDVGHSSAWLSSANPRWVPRHQRQLPASAACRVEPRPDDRRPTTDDRRSTIGDQRPASRSRPLRPDACRWLRRSSAEHRQVGVSIDLLTWQIVSSIVGPARLGGAYDAAFGPPPQQEMETSRCIPATSSPVRGAKRAGSGGQSTCRRDHTDRIARRHS